MYANGNGVRQDSDKAKEWHCKACAKIDRESCADYRNLIRRGY